MTAKIADGKWYKSKVHHESPEQSKADLRVNDKEIILMFSQLRRLSTGSGMGITTSRDFLRLSVTQVVKITKYCVEGQRTCL
jgi:hypothetical protein